MNITKRISKLKNEIKSLYIFNVIKNVAKKTDSKLYLIGGFVRDYILNRKSNDIDIVVVDNGYKFIEQLSNKLNINIKILKRFGTALLKYNNIKIEFVNARKESYNIMSHKPTVTNSSLYDDQKRRDFTINSIAFSINENDFGRLIDPFNGVKDIENNIIKTPINPNKTYFDDPLRMMRAIRLSTQLNFNLSNESLETINLLKNRISIVAQERITDEINKIIMTNKPSIGFIHLFNTGLLNIIFYELTQLQGIDVINNQYHKDNFYHTLEVLDNVALLSSNIWLRWSAILHDIAKPIVKKFDKKNGWTFHDHDIIGSNMVYTIFKKLKLPLNHNMKFVKKLVALHLRPLSLCQNTVKDSAIRRFMIDSNNCLNELIILCNADITTKNIYKLKIHRQKIEFLMNKIKDIELKDKMLNWKYPINGNEIMNLLSLKEGKIIGKIKKDIKNNIINGIIKNNKKDVIKYLLSINI